MCLTKYMFSTKIILFVFSGFEPLFKQYKVSLMSNWGMQMSCFELFYSSIYANQRGKAVNIFIQQLDSIILYILVIFYIANITAYG